MTGFFRDGCCRACDHDRGRHLVCARVTQDFLELSRSRGNDLSSPVPAFGFPGLRPGDRWCLCADRWEEARQVGLAPPVVLEATHEAVLETLVREDLEAHAIPPGTGGEA